jgi:N-methylhydantoinase B
MTSVREPAFDPILTQVIGSYVLSAAEEMGLALMRTAYSTNIKERGDCSTAIFDAAGRTLAQASHVPLHLAALMGLVEQVLKAYPLGTIRPGDVFLANDPYQGVGSQLNDIAATAPVFHDGVVVAFVANIAHHSDVGGRFPGSEAAASTTVYEEGLRLPVVRLYRQGEFQDDILRIIQTNSRVPRNIEGDLKAQVASIRIGIRRMEELHDRYQREVVAAGFAAWLDSAETRIRAAIDRVPDGSYSFTDFADDEEAGAHAEPLALTVALTVSGSDLTFDFAGCPPQVANSHNATYLALLATVYYAAKAILDPEVPPNAGYYRAITVEAPHASIVNAASPAAVGTRNHTCQKLVDVIMGALAQAVPERVVAGSASSKLMIIGGVDPRSGRPFIDYEASAGGLGARFGKDGLDVSRAHMTNTGNLPIEALEQEDPLLVTRYEMVADTGGPGRFRGGLGARRDTRMLGPGFEHSGFAIGHQFPGVGLQGGERGRVTSGSMLILNAGTEHEIVLHPAAHHRLAEDDVLSVFTPGGGGFGDPFSRDPSSVADDVSAGKVTRRGAERDYGVVVGDDGLVDVRATEELRSAG